MPWKDLITPVAQLAGTGSVRSLHKNPDTTTPGGRLVFHVFVALAEFIAALIRGHRTSIAGRPERTRRIYSGLSTWP